MKFYLFSNGNMQLILNGDKTTAMYMRITDSSLPGNWCKHWAKIDVSVEVLLKFNDETDHVSRMLDAAREISYKEFIIEML